MMTYLTKSNIGQPELPRLEHLNTLLASREFMHRLPDVAEVLRQRRYPLTWNFTEFASAFGVTRDLDWTVLDLRYGASERLTHSAIARRLPGGPSIARVRHIAHYKVLSIGRMFAILADYLDKVEEDIVNEAIPFVSAIESAWSEIEESLIASGWEDVHEADFAHLLLVLRIVHISGREPYPLIHRFPVLCNYAGIERNNADMIGNPSTRYRPTFNGVDDDLFYVPCEQVAIAVLLDAGRPLHYVEIAKRAEALRYRQRVSLHVLQRKLQTSQAFTQLSQGTYDLAARVLGVGDC